MHLTIVARVALFASLYHAVLADEVLNRNPDLGANLPPVRSATISSATPKPTNSQAFVSSWLASMSSVHASSLKLGQTTIRKTSLSTTKTSTAKKTTTTTRKTTTTTSKRKTTTKKTTTTTKKKTTTKAKTTAKPATSKAKVKAKVASKLSGRDVFSAGQSESTPLKRDVNTGCTNLEPNLYKYIGTDQSPSGYLLNPLFSSTASGNWLPPAGYSTVFTNIMGATQLDSYLTYVQLASYDTSRCAAACNAVANCQSFNIYYLRAPAYTPDPNTCQSPDARGSIICSLYSNWIDASSANNTGQYRINFLTTVSGSNGYNKNPPPPTYNSYRGPVALVGAVNGTSSTYYLGNTYYSSLNTSGCAALCNNLTASNRAAAIAAGNATYVPCNYWNVWNMTLSNVFQSMYCTLYSSQVVLNTGVQNNLVTGTPAKTYNMTLSYGYALFPQDLGLVNTTWVAAPQGSSATCANTVAQYGTSLLDNNYISYNVACNNDILYGGDLTNFTSTDFYSCFDMCDNYSGCSGFSFAYNTCWLKNLTNFWHWPSNMTSGGVDLAWLPSKYAGYLAGAPPSVTNYRTPVPMFGAIDQGNAAISPYFLQYLSYPTFDSAPCANACSSLTSTNKAAAMANGWVSYTSCNYFSVYNITVGGNFTGTSCQLFSSSSVAGAAALTNATLNTNVWNVTLSYGYALSTPDPGNMVNCANYLSYTPAVLDGNLIYYSLGCRYSIAGAALGSATAPSFAACFKLCDAVSGCSGFSYSGGQCWFKNMYGVSTAPVANISDNSAWQNVYYAGGIAIITPISLSIAPTTRTVYSGSGTTTSISTYFINGTASVVVTSPSTAALIFTTTMTTDSGMATTPTTSTISTKAGSVTVLTIYPTPTLTCNNMGVRYAAYWTANNPAVVSTYKTMAPYASTVVSSTSTKTSTVTRSGTTTVTSATTTIVTSALAASPTGVATQLRYLYLAQQALPNMYSIGPVYYGSAYTIGHTWYIFAGRGTGYYTISVPYTDDTFYMWSGSKALSGWDNSNFDVYRNWTMGTSAGYGYSVYLTQGTYYPLRALWANTGGDSELQIWLYGPDGSYMSMPFTSSNMVTGYLTPQIITQPCDTKMAQRPWPAWGSET